MIYTKTKQTIKLIYFKRRWKKNNKHNYTTAKNIFPINLVKVGKYSYGPLEVYYWGSPNEFLEIKNFCSIASGVKFILGGNHVYKTISTYPFKKKVLKEKTIEAYTKGKITINDDVWIGMDAKILSGVNIGQGAIVAAGSVVASDIEPYAIYAGCPARKIKSRFPEEIIEHLMKIDFNLITDINHDLIDLLYSEINEDNIKELVDKISKFKF